VRKLLAFGSLMSFALVLHVEMAWRKMQLLVGIDMKRKPKVYTEGCRGWTGGASNQAGLGCCETCSLSGCPRWSPLKLGFQNEPTTSLLVT